MAAIYNFFGRICDYLRENFWEADFGQYENFNLRLPGITLGQLVLFTMIACILACALAAYQRSYLGQIVRALYAREAFDPDHACTLSDLGLAEKRLLRFELCRPQSVLRKSMRYVGESAPTYTDKHGRTRYRTREKLDFQAVRFYLPEGLRERAIVRFSGKGSDGRALILGMVLAFVGGILVIRVLPLIFSLADGILGMIGG